MLKRILLGLFIALSTVAFFNIPSALSIPSLQERKDAKISNVPHWKTSTITVYIPKNQRAASMRRAFQQWQAVSAGHLNFKFVQSGPANIDVVFVEKVSGNDGPLGEYKREIKGGYITKAEIKLATKSPAIKKYSNDYIYTTMLHEVGHALGLPDRADKPTTIMHMPLTSDQDIKKLDIKNLFAVYDWSRMDRR